MINNVVDLDTNINQPDWDTDDLGPLVTFDDDAIALAWASYGVWLKRPAHRWAEFKDLQAYPHDHEMAKATRRYYRDRYLLKGLSGNPLTRFQQRVWNIIETGDVYRRDLGILYRLPYFYVEDTDYDYLKTETVGLSGDHLLYPTEKSHLRYLSPVKRIYVSRRSGDEIEFWYRDEKNAPVLWCVTEKNPLRTLVESLWRDHGRLEFRANFHYGRRPERQHNFWYMSGVELP